MRLPSVVIRSDVLESWLTVSDYSKSRLASELGVSKGRISQLLTSREEPSAHLIAKLMTLTFLPFDRLFVIVHDNPSRISSSRLATRTQKTSNGRRSRGVLGHSRGLSALKGAS